MAVTENSQGLREKKTSKARTELLTLYPGLSEQYRLSLQVSLARKLEPSSRPPILLTCRAGGFGGYRGTLYTRGWRWLVSEVMRWRVLIVDWPAPRDHMLVGDEGAPGVASWGNVGTVYE